MPKNEVPLQKLEDYLPNGATNDVLHYLQLYKVHLTVTRKRQSILGDYRHAHKEKNHRISVNGNLNKYSFLITLLHELAHLFTFEKYGNKVSPHGKEWKESFSQILASFLNKNIFPQDIKIALNKTLQNPSATSCGDEQLLRTLRHYDPQKEGFTLVEQITEGAYFEIKGGRKFIRGAKIRKRIKCEEVGTGKHYLFSGLYEVKIIQ